MNLARELAFLAEARRRLDASDSDVTSLVTEAASIADRTGAAVVRADLARFGLLARV